MEARAETALVPDFLDALSSVANSVVVVTCRRDGRPWEMTGDGAAPMLVDALAHLDCEVTDTVPVADHVLILGRVRQAQRPNRERSPLLYHRRSFRRLDGV